ncbi:MAG: DNA primase [Planctomycetota bacterium]
MDRFEEAKAKIKDAVDLVSLVERYLPLKRAGRNMVGLCPFHAEKSPSFTVNAATQHYKCFGCGKAGDVFSFLMEREGLDFRAAFEALAERAGVSIDGVFKQGGGGEGRSARTAAAQALGAVNAYFQAALQSGVGEAARSYLDRRGLLAAAEAFGLGFHPPGGELNRFVRARKLPHDLLQAAGLFGRDGMREPFAGRLTFPIVDEAGRIVGFGGRVLAAGQEPKYLNSPESPHFNKRRLLFGLRQAKEAGVRRLIVVEGYTDVIACHLAGFQGAVATLGTSLTADHARLLLRWATEGVVLLFDGDRAGRQAAERALRELSNVDIEVRIAFLPEGKDPADILAEGDEPGQRMRALLAQAEDPVVSWFKLLRERHDLRDAVGAARAAQECAALLSGVENPVRRDTMLRRMAPWFGGDEGALRRLLRPRGAEAAAEASPATAAAAPQPRRTGKSRSGRGPGGRFGREERPVLLDDAAVARALGGGASAPVSAGTSPGRPDAAPSDAADRAPVDRALIEAEVDLLACVLARPDLHAHLAALEFQDAAAAEVAAALCACARDAALTMERLAQHAFSKIAVDSAPAARVLAAAVERVHHIREPEMAFEATDGRRRQHIARLEARRVRVELEQARVAGDRSKVDDLTRRFYAHFRQHHP